MKLLSLLAAAMGIAKLGNAPTHSFRSGTPGKRYREKPNEFVDGCPQSKKDDWLPRGYPGAKLARKAAMKFAAVKHPRGLRADGVTC